MSTHEWKQYAILFAVGTVLFCILAISVLFKLEDARERVAKACFGGEPLIVNVSGTPVSFTCTRNPQ